MRGTLDRLTPAQQAAIRRRNDFLLAAGVLGISNAMYPTDSDGDQLKIYDGQAQRYLVQETKKMDEKVWIDLGGEGRYGVVNINIMTKVGNGLGMKNIPCLLQRLGGSDSIPGPETIDEIVMEATILVGQEKTIGSWLRPGGHIQISGNRDVIEDFVNGVAARVPGATIRWGRYTPPGADPTDRAFISYPRQRR